MTTWKIDAAHSEVNFKVKHLVVSTVRGNFDKFDATIETNKEDFSDAVIKFEADINSINTKMNNAMPPKSADFFDAENHQKMTFQSTVQKSLRL
jgi:polyisoprenoid-binding protein YceI